MYTTIKNALGYTQRATAWENMLCCCSPAQCYYPGLLEISSSKGYMLKGLQKGKKHLVPHYAVSVLTVQCMVFMYAYGNDSDPSFLIKSAISTVKILTPKSPD